MARPTNGDPDAARAVRQQQRAAKAWEREMKAQQARRSQKAKLRTLNTRRAGRRSG
jgi:hypothetical protein